MVDRLDGFLAVVGATALLVCAMAHDVAGFVLAVVSVALLCWAIGARSGGAE